MTLTPCKGHMTHPDALLTQNDLAFRASLQPSKDGKFAGCTERVEVNDKESFTRSIDTECGR